MFMLSLAIIMTAGGASTIHQSFNLPVLAERTHISRFILATLFLKFDRLIAVLWRCYTLFNCDCHYDCGLLFHNESF